jgi:D-serine deaminase-like pyridoxal phosphate-dependent protein
VLYGVPVAPSQLTRLANISRILGGSEYISVLVDHPDTLDFINQSHSQWASDDPISVYIKIDTGYHRAGVLPESKQLQNICSKLSDPTFQGHIKVAGLYSHLGHSYGFDKPEQSLDGLITEFETLVAVTKKYPEAFPAEVALSVGATPTTTAAQALASADAGISQRWDVVRKSGHAMELHAGVYPFLDLQQLATHARASNLDYKDIGLRILVEVASLYPERSPPEALVAAGNLALGREPCKSYSGWGVVSPWRAKGHSSGNHYSEEKQTGWIVGRISQEHGILAWQGDESKLEEIQIGQKLLVWPNHACIAGAGYDFYLVVDSDSGDGDVVRDLWIRCRGW